VQRICEHEEPLMKIFLATVVAATLTAARAGNAQSAPVGGSACDYQTCALTIAPRWNGLAIVRGISGETVDNLNFFFPHDIGAALGANGGKYAGADSVAVAAQRAVQLRRIGAVFTDVGLLALLVGAVGAATSASNSHANGVLLGIGVAALGVSVPFQFAADGALSKAIWWYNLRYARSGPAQ